METTEKIYKCGHCGDTNDSLESLKQHMVSVHMPTQAPPIPTPVHRPAASTSGGDLMVVEADPSHLPIRQDRPIKKPTSSKFKCGHCGVVVNGLDGLKAHMLSDHVKDNETAKELAKADIPQKGEFRRSQA